MNKYLVVWAKSEDVVHINYHYTQLGECVDQLERVFPGQVLAVDCDIEQIDVNEFIKKNGIKKVIMQVNYENAQNAFKMCDEIKSKHEDIPVLAYGSIPIRVPRIFLASNFDLIHREGDPEVCMKSFIRYYETGEPSSEMQGKIMGASIVREGRFLQTQPGKYISPNSWGVSKQEHVPIDKYDEIKGKNRYVLNISRGCPFGCPHCLIQLTEGRTERRRSIENLREAIKQIKDKYKHIKIWAANFTLDKKYVNAFCEMMSSDFPDITWECATRIDLVRDEEMLKAMQGAGCRQISLGIESLNNGELIQTKDFEESEIAQAISRIQDSGIQVKGCVMLGMPNQKKESIVRTLGFLRGRNVIARPTIYTPYQHLPENATVADLGRYNRKTYENNNVPGVTSEQLQQLVKNPYNFEQILNIGREKTDHFDDDDER